MRIKNEYEHIGLVAAGRAVAEVLDALCRAAVPGTTTSCLDALAGTLLEQRGARATPKREYDFPGHLCVSVNDEVVHGIPGGRVLREGDLVKLDLTADKQGFVADATRMAILPPVDEAVRRLAEAARLACEAAVPLARDGMRLDRLGGAIEAAATREGFRVVRALCGHGVGRHTHEEPEVPNFADRNNRGVLATGMVITIEPILCSGTDSLREHDDGWTISTRDGSMSAHYEETVIVGPEGGEVVTRM